MNKVFRYTLTLCLALMLFGGAGCAKKADPNYKASLDHAKEMSKEENRSVRTFEMTGGEEGMVILGVKSITTRKPLDPVGAPSRPTTGMDVAGKAVGVLGDVTKAAIPVAGKVWLGVKALETAETLAEDNVHIVEQPAPIVVEQPPPVIIDPVIVEPEPPVIVEPPVVIVDPPDPIIIDPSYPPETGVNSGDPMP